MGGGGSRVGNLTAIADVLDTQRRRSRCEDLLETVVVACGVSILNAYLGGRKIHIIMCGINHLCGLDLADTLPNLTDDERKVLSEFRERYESDRPSGIDINNNVSGEEKKEVSVNSDDGEQAMLPTYELASLEELHESGWRPLDDVTLYRYLSADRRADGSFDVGELHW